MNARKIEITIVTETRRRRSIIVTAEIGYIGALKKAVKRQVLEPLQNANTSKNIQLQD